ncbi:hypothetical protein D9615_008484 [Tricholomella constricta]|uniref:Nephrocystin 3-like N-terminal domain-containing protein n=1 Tax=Tricholomella constricta TaxID=117010 RepID=A0A8H5H4I1_9AGAR|nr:hypothetical protein D9615_008484 [Tricholomella constricta]
MPFKVSNNYLFISSAKQIPSARLTQAQLVSVCSVNYPNTLLNGRITAFQRLTWSPLNHWLQTIARFQYPPSMAFKNARNTHIYDSSFTEVHGDFHSYSSGGSLSINQGETGLQTLFQATSPGAAYDSQERYPPPKCHPGTRQAILDALESWITNESERGEGSVMWLHGPAGAGKSAVAQTISESCAKRGELAASFFFSRGKAGRDSINFLFTTIAFHMAIASRDLRREIRQAVENDPSIIHKATSTQIQALIVEPLLSRSCRLDAAARPPYLIIIDGLDECRGNADQRQILTHVVDLVYKHHLPLYFLIVSRPEPHIRHAFDEPTMQTINLQVLSLLGVHRAIDDVLLFLHDGFTEIHRAEKHSDIMQFVPKPWPSKDIVELLATKSGGYFIYASTVLKFIDEEYYSPLDRLDEVLNASSTSTSTPFAELDKLYTQILSTCPHTDRLKRVLGYLLAPSDRLSNPPWAATIETVLNLRRGEVRLTLRGLHSLLGFTSTSVLDENSEIVGVDISIQSLHASLGDFLFDKERAGKFYIDLEECHADIVRGSWTIFSNWVTKNGESLYLSTRQHLLDNFCFHLSQVQEKRQLLDDFKRGNKVTWAPFVQASTRWPSLKWKISHILYNVLKALQSLVTPPEAFIRQLVDLSDFVYLTHLSPRSQKDVQFIQGMFTTFYFETRSLFSAPDRDCLEIAKLLQLDVWSSHQISPTSNPPSFAEFMSDPLRSGDLFSDSALRHARLAVCCIDMLGIKWDLDHVLTRERHKFTYARKYWAEHLSRAPYGDENMLHFLRNSDAETFFGQLSFINTFLEAELREDQEWNTARIRPDSPDWRQPFKRSVHRPSANYFRQFFPEYRHDDLEDFAVYQGKFRELDMANAKLVVNWLKAATAPPFNLISRWEAYCRDGLPGYGIVIKPMTYPMNRGEGSTGQAERKGTKLVALPLQVCSETRRLIWGTVS